MNIVGIMMIMMMMMMMIMMMMMMTADLVELAEHVHELVYGAATSTKLEDALRQCVEAIQVVLQRRG